MCSYNISLRTKHVLHDFPLAYVYLIWFRQKVQLLAISLILIDYSKMHLRGKVLISGQTALQLIIKILFKSFIGMGLII